MRLLQALLTGLMEGRSRARKARPRRARAPSSVESLEPRLALSGNDGFIRSPDWPTIAGTEFGSTAYGYAVRVDASEVIQVTWKGGRFATPSNPGGGWEALGTRPSDAGYRLLWHNVGNGAYREWNLTASGVFAGGRGVGIAEVISIEPEVGIDINGDDSVGFAFTPSGVEVQGVEFGSTPYGYALRTDGTQVIPVTARGGKFATPSNPGGGWQALGAMPSGDGYQLLWRHAPTGAFQTWTLNASGSRTGGRGVGLAEILALESQLGIDITGDGVFGAGFTPSGVTIQGVEFGSTPYSYALRTGGSRVIPVTWKSGQFATPANNVGPGWAPLGAMPSGNGFQLLWRNNFLDAYYAWTLNPSGARTGGRGVSKAEIFDVESRLGIDITGDGDVGLGFTPSGVSIQGIEFGSTRYGYALRTNGSKVIPVTWKAGQFATPTNPGAGWEPLGAMPSGNGYRLLWRNGVIDVYYAWTLNASGAWVSGWGVGIDEIHSLEVQLDRDITGDDIIGSPLGGGSGGS